MKNGSDPEERNTAKKFSFFGEGALQGYCDPAGTFFWKQESTGDGMQSGSCPSSTAPGMKIKRINTNTQLHILFEWRIKK